MTALPHSRLTFGDFVIDAKRRVLARRNADVLVLTPKQFDTLLFLAEHPNEVLEKDRLMDAIWPGMVVEENNLNQVISQLRRILGDDGGENRFIVTVPRRGYRFVADVTAGEPVPTATATPDITPASAPQAPAPEAAMPAVNPDPAPPQAQPPARANTGRAGVLPAALAILVLAAGLVWLFKFQTPATEAGKSIAVLPFTNFSGDKDDEFFGDGMTEDLVTQLAQISDLKVISRTSIMRFKDSKRPLKEIARELGVAHILQGTVRRGDGRFRITVQLIDPEREGHLWAKSYDREMKDVLTVQSEVTAEIADALKAKLLAPERELQNQYANEPPEAHALFQKGRHLVRPYAGYTDADREKARGYFEQIIRNYPNSPLGYVGLALYFTQKVYTDDMRPADAYARADELARKALALNEKSVEANLLLANVRGLGYWQWQEAETLAKRAVALNPGSADAWLAYSMALEPVGRLDEALDAARRANLLDPLNSYCAVRLASILIAQRRYDDAITQSRANLELDRRFLPNYALIARSHERKGEFAEALAAHRAAQWSWLPNAAIDELQAALAAEGAKGYWRVRFRFQKAHAATTFNQHYFTAAFAAQAGETEEVFRALEIAVDQRDIFISQLKIDPQFDSVRADPRFDAILRRINLK